jgi:hypothetical protein
MFCGPHKTIVMIFSTCEHFGGKLNKKRRRPEKKLISKVILIFKINRLPKIPEQEPLKLVWS